MKFSNLPSFCLLLLALTTNLRAEFVQPVAVQASNGENVQDALINGLGFDDSTLGSPESIHSPAQSEMWSGIGSIKADVTFDLGQTVDLTKIYIWNYNVQNNTDVGMKDVEVLVSSGTNITNSVFTGIAKIALREGLDSAQAFNVVGTSVRLVKLRGLSNWGQGYSVGLAEVRFASGDITGEVPTLVISSPHEGDVIPLGTSVTLDVKVTDKDNDILKIEIFDGTVKLGETNRAPVLWNVPAPSNGEHAYRIVATDKSGKVGWSTVNIVVRELAADGILQIDDTENIGEGTNTITYTGTWNLAQGNANDPRFKNNDHYSDVRNAYFEVRFKGVKVDVYGTVASHHGSGIATIDGGTEYTVSYKATQRKEQALVWSSPILPNKEHVLRIRVQGNGVITADRFDVHISNKPDQELPTTKKITATFTNLVVEIEDATGGALDATSVKLFIDETLATPASISVTKAAPLTVITHTPASPFLPGSSHNVRVEAKLTGGLSITNTGTFTLPSPPFSLSGLGSPAGSAGNWAFRQIWNGGRADALVTAVSIALQASQTGFAGMIQDTNVPVINFGESTNPGAGGIMPDDLPLPAETSGLTENDFVIVARGNVVIPRPGDWTIGVHTDEGFALRFKGAPFASVHGNGERDENFPEYMMHQVNTADSNTRGILRNLPAGVYEIELLSWERAGTASYEIYAAEGAFEEDAATEDWRLIGGAEGLALAAPVAPATPTRFLTIKKTGNLVTLDFETPRPAGPHVLQSSPDLVNWSNVVNVTFSPNGAGMARGSAMVAGEPFQFYRIFLSNPAP